MTNDEPIEGTLLPDGTPLPKGLKDAQAGYSFFPEESDFKSDRFIRYEQYARQYYGFTNRDEILKHWWNTTGP